MLFLQPLSGIKQAVLVTPPCFMSKQQLPIMPAKAASNTGAASPDVSPLALPPSTVIEECDEEVAPEKNDRIMVLKEPWLGLILAGKKTMEIRSCRARCGSVWLGQGGKIHGRVTITQAVKLTEEQFRSCTSAHLWPSDRPPPPYKTLCGLSLAEPRPLPAPLPYWRPPRGPIGWNRFRTSEQDHEGPTKRRRTSKPSTPKNPKAKATKAKEIEAGRAMKPTNKKKKE